MGQLLGVPLDLLFLIAILIINVWLGFYFHLKPGQSYTALIDCLGLALKLGAMQERTNLLKQVWLFPVLQLVVIKVLLFTALNLEQLHKKEFGGLFAIRRTRKILQQMCTLIT